MTLSPLTRLVLVSDHRPLDSHPSARRYRLARLDLRTPEAEDRFEHLKRVYD